MSLYCVATFIVLVATKINMMSFAVCRNFLCQILFGKHFGDCVDACIYERVNRHMYQQKLLIHCFRLIVRFFYSIEMDDRQNTHTYTIYFYWRVKEKHSMVTKFVECMRLFVWLIWKFYLKYWAISWNACVCVHCTLYIVLLHFANGLLEQAPKLLSSASTKFFWLF